MLIFIHGVRLFELVAKLPFGGSVISRVAPLLH